MSLKEMSILASVALSALVMGLAVCGCGLTFVPVGDALPGVSGTGGNSGGAGDTAGSQSISGTGGQDGCTGVVACPEIGCGPGSSLSITPGSCCPTCVPDSGGVGSSSNGVCSGIGACPAIACGNGFELTTLTGECCPTCAPQMSVVGGVPADACGLGQQAYASLRSRLLSQPGALTCQQDEDCTLLTRGGACAIDQCAAFPVNAASFSAVSSELRDFELTACSTCAPPSFPCSAALPAVCTDGQCPQCRS